MDIPRSRVSTPMDNGTRMDLPRSRISTISHGQSTGQSIIKKKWPFCALVSTRSAADAVEVWFSVVIGFSYLSAHS